MMMRTVQYNVHTTHSSRCPACKKCKLLATGEHLQIVLLLQLSLRPCPHQVVERIQHQTFSGTNTRTYHPRCSA